MCSAMKRKCSGWFAPPAAAPITFDNSHHEDPAQQEMCCAPIISLDRDAEDGNHSAMSSIKIHALLAARPYMSDGLNHQLQVSLELAQ